MCSNSLGEGDVPGRAIGVRLRLEDEGLDAVLLSALESADVSAVRTDRDNLDAVVRSGRRVDQGLEICPASRDEDHDSCW